jgi:acetyltransferase EpsM
MEQGSGLPWLGTDEDSSNLVRDGTSSWFVLGVGGVGPSKIRRDLVSRYTAVGDRWASIIHAAAHVSPSATIGKGVVILSGVVVNCGAVLGDHCVINSGAVIGGGAVLEEDCYVGLGARVRDHVTVGCGAMVGMGAVVVGTVPAGLTVIGVPARVRKQ